MKKVAILQSNYIPWKGYFDLINMVDEFIIYDDCQYTKRDWRNRNRIKTAKGTIWLTIPVMSKSRSKSRIFDIKVIDKHWSIKHLRSISFNYKNSPFFHDISAILEETYSRLGSERYLSKINHSFIAAICGLLSIQTKIVPSSQYDVPDSDATDKIVSLCRQANASRYLSGPAARQYLDTSRFESIGCQVDWMRYEGYPEYPQLHPPFEHSVSIIDLLANVGREETKNHMLSFGRSKP